MKIEAYRYNLSRTLTTFCYTNVYIYIICILVNKKINKNNVEKIRKSKRIYPGILKDLYNFFLLKDTRLIH